MSRTRASSAALVGVALMLMVPALASGSTGFVEPDVVVLTTHVGADPADNFGWVGAALGDLNGDGVADYGITAITDAAGGFLAGKAYVYSGSDGSVLHSIEGVAGELLGYSMDSAGDVNADGIPDYIVGAPGFNAVTPTPFGRAIVLSGADHSVIHEFTPSTLTRMGTAVAGAGDVNGDGHDDVIVGSQGAGATKGLAGRVTVYSGADGSALWSRHGDHAWDLMGSAADVIGDVNGDGVPDQVVGAYGATGRNGGAAGTSGRGAAYILSGADGSKIHTLRPRGDAVNFARFFARRAGDIDGDGTPDAFVADYGAGRGGQGGASALPGSGTPVNGTGAAYVFSGATGRPILILEGSAFGEGLGPGRVIDDENGDGHADLLVAAYTSSAGAPLAGVARVYSGSDGQILRTITSTTAGELLGVDALSIGDVDGDGRDDYLLTGGGVAYVVAG